MVACDNSVRYPRARAFKMLAASTVGMSLGYSVIGYAGFGMFVLPLSEAFGWGRGDISVAFTIMSYVVALAVPALGFLIDKLGPRTVLLPSIISFSIVVAMLSQLSANIALFYGAYLFVALTGAGTTPAVYTRAIVQWFDRHRGLALGIALAGPGIGAALAPPVLQFAIDTFGWRGAYLALGLTMFVLSFPIVWFWFHAPTPSDDNSDGPSASVTQGFSFRDSLKMRVTWQMIAAFFLLGILTGGIAAHLFALLRDRGFEASVAASAVSLLGVSVIVGRVLTGVLLDRFRAPLIIGLCLLTASVGLATLNLSSSDFLAICAVLAIGLAIGSEFDFMSFLISRYHGLVAYARIYGLIYGTFTAGAGLGPLLLGYGFQNLGTYDHAIWVLVGTTTLATALLGTLGNIPEQSSGER